MEVRLRIIPLILENVEYDGHHPGPIDNFSLVDKEGNDKDTSALEFRLKPSLTENIHFAVLNKKMWNALSHWYGGGPPIRRMRVEIFEVRSVISEC